MAAVIVPRDTIAREAVRRLAARKRVEAQARATDVPGWHREVQGRVILLPSKAPTDEEWAREAAQFLLLPQPGAEA